MLEKNVQKPTYCEAVKGGQEQGTKKAHLITQSGQGHSVKAQDHTLVDAQTVNLDTARTKAEKTDYAAIKQKLQ